MRPGRCASDTIPDVGKRNLSLTATGETHRGQGTARGNALRGLVAVVSIALFASCSSSGDELGAGPDSSVAADSGARVNEIQVIGSHNSYHQRPTDPVASGLEGIAPSLFAEIDYGHESLTDQLERFGIRQFELDVVADPNGGLYSRRVGLEVLGEDPESHIPELDEPGFKVLHIQDIDFETSCYLLTQCLTEIHDWSAEHPRHLPVMVMIETKSDTIEAGAEDLGLTLPPDLPPFTVPVPMSEQLFDDLDAEIRSIFDADEMITPDDVRGSSDTLEGAVLTDGWPTIESARGKVLFSLNDTGPTKDMYLAQSPILEGRVMFTTGTPGEPDAAFTRVDDPIAEGAQIKQLVLDGYLVRTRTDVPGEDAVDNDVSRRDAAFESGANYLSTDYYRPDPALSDYVVRFADNAIARCDPVSATERCGADDVGET